MKKVISLFFLSLTAFIYISAQSIDLGNFENDSSLWGNWGGRDSVIDNPFPEGNNSTKVLRYRPDTTWQGISRWFDNGILQAEHKSISLDVYVDTITVLQLALLTPVVEDEIFIKDTIFPGAWQHVVFDISNAPILTYQHIAFQTSEETTYYFDNININAETKATFRWTQFNIEKKVFGTYSDSSDFNAQIALRWDSDSLYMILKVQDDSLVTEGTQYLVDNTEIYLDLDNSKRVHWPRNGAWIENDTTFDDNDFQLRLIPGKEWTYTIENQQLEGVNYLGLIDSTGYSFYLNIPWDSLMPGFQASDSTIIGFDMLISDNDSVASDAARNQITLNAPTIYAYNDPSLWASLKLDSSGTFTQIADTFAPTPPSIVIATAHDTSVTITWTSANDNTAVQYYIVKQNNISLDTLLALKQDNVFQINNLPEGSYTFSIVAMDIYNNSSSSTASDTLEIIRTIIADIDNEAFIAYPNPATNYIHLKNIVQDNTHIAIYNNLGILVLSKKIDQNESLNISGLKQGIYFMQISDKTNVSLIRLIKN